MRQQVFERAFLVVVHAMLNRVTAGHLFVAERVNQRGYRVMFDLQAGRKASARSTVARIVALLIRIPNGYSVPESVPPPSSLSRVEKIDDARMLRYATHEHMKESMVAEAKPNRDAGRMAVIETRMDSYCHE